MKSIPSKRECKWFEDNGNFKTYPFVELLQQKSTLKDILVVQQIIWNLTLNPDRIFSVPKRESCRMPKLSDLSVTLFIRKQIFQQ